MDSYDDYDDNYYDDVVEDQNEFTTTYADRDRLNRDDGIMGTTFGEGSYGDKYRRQAIMGRSSEEIYIENLRKAYHDISEAKSSQSLEFFVDKSKMMKHIEYRNPIPFILGYICITRDKRVNKEILNKVYKNYGDKRASGNDGVSVGKDDIIRYARHWVKFLL